MIVIRKGDEKDWWSQKLVGYDPIPEPHLCILADPGQGDNPTDVGWVAFVTTEKVDVVGRLMLLEFQTLYDPSFTQEFVLLPRNSIQAQLWGLWRRFYVWVASWR